MATAIITATELSDQLSTMAGFTEPAGLTTARKEAIISRVSGEVLAAFGVDELSDLTSVRQDAAKSACIAWCISEVLLALTLVNLAKEYRQRAISAIDRSITGAAAAQPRGSGPPGLNLV